MGGEAGFVEVKVTDHGGHAPQVWAEMALREIISVSMKAPQPIRDQALAFQDKVHEILLRYMKLVAQSERERR